MSDTMFMGTSARHNRLLAEAYRRLANYFEDLIIQNKVLILLEQVALCYYGEFKESELVKLIDIADFNIAHLNDLHTVQPDLMLFDKNAWVTNESCTRYAGKPDLIIEVWSNSNDEAHRKFKKYLYNSSDITEHWYLTQDSNIRLPAQL